MFVLDVLTAMIITGYGNSYLLDTLDAPPEYPAFALGVYGLVKFATAPPGGWLIDHVRPAFTLTLVGVLLTGGVVVMLAVGTANGFIVGVGILSAGVTLFWLIVVSRARRLAAAGEPRHCKRLPRHRVGRFDRPRLRPGGTARRVSIEHRLRHRHRTGGRDGGAPLAGAAPQRRALVRDDTRTAATSMRHATPAPRRWRAPSYSRTSWQSTGRSSRSVRSPSTCSTSPCCN